MEGLQKDCSGMPVFGVRDAAGVLSGSGDQRENKRNAAVLFALFSVCYVCNQPRHRLYKGAVYEL